MARHFAFQTGRYCLTFRREAGIRKVETGSLMRGHVTYFFQIDVEPTLNGWWCGCEIERQQDGSGRTGPELDRAVYSPNLL